MSLLNERLLEWVNRYKITNNVPLTDPGLPIPQSEEFDDDTGNGVIRVIYTSDGEQKQFLHSQICFHFLQYGHSGLHSS